MNRDADNLVDVQWVAQCAECLRGQWPRADPTSLADAARALWADDALRRLTPSQAALGWLRRGLPESVLIPTLRDPTSE